MGLRSSCNPCDSIFRARSRSYSTCYALTACDSTPGYNLYTRCRARKPRLAGLMNSACLRLATNPLTLNCHFARFRCKVEELVAALVHEGDDYYDARNGCPRDVNKAMGVIVKRLIMATTGGTTTWVNAIWRDSGCPRMTMPPVSGSARLLPCRMSWQRCACRSWARHNLRSIRDCGKSKMLSNGCYHC